MEDKVEIRLPISGWTFVKKEVAKAVVEHWLKSITMMEGQKKIDYINSKNLKGITVEELLGE